MAAKDLMKFDLATFTFAGTFELYWAQCCAAVSFGGSATAYAEFRGIRGVRGVRESKYCVAENERGVNRFLSMRRTQNRFQFFCYKIAPRRP